MEKENKCEKNIIREIKKIQIMFEKNLNRILEKYDLIQQVLNQHVHVTHPNYFN